MAPVQDLLKTSKKENFIGNARPGNWCSNTKKMTVHDVNDIARTTIKETNIHNNRSGNMNGPNKLTVYDPNDIARTTIKETNIHNNKTGNLSGPSKSKSMTLTILPEQQLKKLIFIIQKQVT